MSTASNREKHEVMTISVRIMRLIPVQTQWRRESVTLTQICNWHTFQLLCKTVKFQFFWAKSCADHGWHVSKTPRASSQALCFSYPWDIFVIIIINPLTARVVGAQQKILQPVFSTFPCSPLPPGACQTPGLSIPWCCLPTSSSVCFVFFPLSLCLARWFWPDLMNGKHDHTIAVCVSLRFSGCLHMVQLPAGSWHRLPHW